MKARPPKKKCQALHALKRLKERYGITNTQVFLGRLVGQITTNQSKFLLRQSNRISIHQVDFEEIKFNVVYDSSRRAIVTFLLDEMVSSLLAEEAKKNVTLYEHSKNCDGR